MTLRLNGSTSGFTEIDAPAVAGSNTLTLPGGNGTNGQVLTTDGAGALSFTTVAGAGSLADGSAAAPSVAFASDVNTGIFRAGNDLLAFSTGGTQRAQFDASGRLLVGTSATLPVYYNATDVWQGLFQVARSDQQAIANFSIWSNNASTYTAYGGTQIHLSACRSGTVGTHTGGALTNGDTIGSITFDASDGTNFRNSARIEAEVDGGVSTGDVPGRLVFATTADGASSPTERMRIGSDGTLSSFAATYNGSFQTAATAGTTYSVLSGWYGATSNGSGGTNSFRVWSNGNVQNTNGSYTTLSDAKLKENIVDAGSQWDDLKAIQIRNWNFKEETGHETHRQIGPIAQELETVCPGLVFETPDRDAEGNETGEVTKGVNQSVLYMKAVKALQEAMERIETLEARLTALEVTP